MKTRATSTPSLVVGTVDVTVRHAGTVVEAYNQRFINRNDRFKHSFSLSADLVLGLTGYTSSDSMTMFPMLRCLQQMSTFEIG